MSGERPSWETTSYNPRGQRTDAQALRSCVVRVVEGRDAGKEVALGERGLIIGRDEDCGLFLDDETVSGQHLRLELEGDGVAVRDLGSKNGTYYLETRIDRAEVPLGATLRVGNTRVTIASERRARGEGPLTLTSYGALIGESPAMRRLYSDLLKLEGSEFTTLILGETGVGKELVAREIHRRSPRVSGPFEVCDCASLSPTLVESELFGHMRGAFTGADQARQGAFERASSGTLFLDEIGELALDLQPKLLRALEAQEVRPLGSSETVGVDCRVVAATNRELEDEVSAGRFRMDLFYRLNWLVLYIPPLRQRREDIPLLLRAFLEELGHADLELSRDTLELFTTGYDWPGNVRELRNAVARFQITGDLPVLGRDADARGRERALAVDVDASFQENKRRLLEAFERDYVGTQLRRHDNNISQAARASAVERNHFKKLLRKHGLL